MPFPQTIYFPRSEKEAFENRARASFPAERDDFMLGCVEKRHLSIYHVVPTLPEHVEYADGYGISLFAAAERRAIALAEQQGLQVVGTIHSHPYRRVKPVGLQLSGADYKAFDCGYESFVLGICKIVPDKQDVTSFRCWFSFWQKHTSLSMRIKLI